MTDERMALLELVERAADADLVREMRAFAAERITDAEVETLTGAGKGARTVLRETHGNGHRERDRDTRAGRIERAVPKLRRGRCVPSVLELRRTAGKALVAFAMVTRTNGVPMAHSKKPAFTASPRAPWTIGKAMGAGGLSKSQVSRICAEIDERVNAFPSRPLEGAWPFGGPTVHWTVV